MMDASHESQEPGRSVADTVFLASGLPPVSRVCVGSVGDPDVVRAAFDAGLNFFVLSTDMHWPLYEATRAGLRDLVRSDPSARAKIVVMAMSYMTRPRFCHAPFDELLAASEGLERVDVSAAGACNERDFLARWNEHASHKESGAHGVRALGASFDDALEAYVALRYRMVDIALVAARPAARTMRRTLFARLGEPPAVPVYGLDVLGNLLREERFQELGIPPTKWRPTAHDYVRYGFYQEGLRGLVCRLPNEGAVRELVDAVEAGPLSAEESEYLESLAELDAGHAMLKREDDVRDST